ncbi:valine--pyruvate transaminase [Photorhabdus laumondii subsp. laumondii]|uniref:Valine--pyruvate aminotransferase (Transaminase C) (Alanine--valine transaminase) n=2 Tax=Photorhabdus laumondii subsp. laumondii TaxID=141679 RepID=Q7N9M9_PHOLL|nr:MULTISPECIES: valine--pyruvate transaminase [Photorhabdus]AWK40273.1 valine--pyruvate transaminase [Photorhabdus laumondii subsp. laumondii]AXG41107.1 valine--pyruvate transaminase [Photorhabdus laumondii subsp. laumondii]AXG45620.1 valine--pyruvate transaminase [Photorhabdus laumondii subsp. laumondii]KTL60887.1 valine--pyruvate aminotransferase [Photorhabdus laumondii subsp. laumondii]MCC8382191.1 valine--pyruvate transaminase [Photorhabdus laumondii]
MIFSQFGNKFTQDAGITRLMNDLNQGLRTPGAIMLGGGNPAHIPEMDDYFQQLLTEMVASGQLTETLCNYDGPQGKDTLIRALAEMLREKLGWEIGTQNIALTNGSQSAFFYLFNLLAGRGEDGSVRKVLFPLAPEYIGYSDSGLDEGLFVANKPNIEFLPEGQFKYHVDFDHLNITEDIGLICVSRPTNPTGNVITDEELQRLDYLAQQHQIPLLIDNAYGVPFPGIIFSEATPLWNPNTILCMSLSKLGLPGSRCGIIIANDKIINAVSNMNGIISLAPGGVGPAMALEMIRRNDLLRLSQEIIRPFYQQRVQDVIQIIRRYLPAELCLIHKPEGAIFLWLWFKNLPITTETLYQRLKKRGVLMVPGHYFFPGLEQDWPHAHECMRMNYVPDPESIAKGIAILAEEIERAHQQAA